MAVAMARRAVADMAATGPPAAADMVVAAITLAQRRLGKQLGGDNSAYSAPLRLCVKNKKTLRQEI